MRGGTRLPRRGSARSARPRTFASQGSLAPKPLRERVGRRGFLAIHDAASKRFRLSVCARAPDRALTAIPPRQPRPSLPALVRRLLRVRSTLLFGRLPLFRSSSASVSTTWPISEKAAPPAPERTSTPSRARAPAISGHQTSFWHEIHPTLRERDARAQQKPRSAESAQAKARQRSVGAYQNAVWRPEIDVFPARETAGRARRPPPSESSARPQTPRRRSAVPFGICRLPPAKGAPFAAASPLRLPLRAEAPRSGKRGCETGGPSTAALRAGHSRCRAPPTARVAVRTRFRHRRCAFTAPHPQGIKPRPSVGKHGSDQLRSAPRHSSRVSRPHSTHRDPARICRSTRPKRIRATGLALAVKATPAAAPSARRPARTRLAVPRPPALPRKRPPYRLPASAKKEGGGEERRNGNHVLAGRRATPPPLAAPFSEGARRASRTPALLL